MKKLALLPTMTAAALAATFALPATAAADTFRHDAPVVSVRGVQPHAINVRPVHNIEHRYSHDYGHGQRWTPPHPRDRGHHYGHQHGYRYGPPARYEQRSAYGPAPRYESRRDSDVRVRISYDLHL